MSTNQIISALVCILVLFLVWLAASKIPRAPNPTGFVEKIGLPTTIYRNSSDYHGPLTGGAVEERCGAFLEKQAPYMKKVEVELFRLQLAKYDNSARYFEWGTGGSTAFASLRTDGTMYSFENQEAWCEKMMAMPYYQCLVSMGKLEYFCAAPIITKSWGFPKREDDRAYFGGYVFGINEIPGDFDIVLVDGRFRVACAMAAFSKMHANSSLLIHDYIRKPYHKIERWFDVVDQYGTLAVLQRKPSTDPPTYEQIMRQMMVSHK